MAKKHIFHYLAMSRRRINIVVLNWAWPYTNLYYTSILIMRHLLDNHESPAGKVYILFVNKSICIHSDTLSNSLKCIKIKWSKLGNRRLWRNKLKLCCKILNFQILKTDLRDCLQANRTFSKMPRYRPVFTMPYFLYMIAARG